MKQIHIKTAALYRFELKYFFLLIFLLAINKITPAQCPPNIDFELGNFTGWQCWVGNVTVFNGKNTINWNPN